MTEGDPIATLRELREYFASSYESHLKSAARIDVTPGRKKPSLEQ